MTPYVCNANLFEGDSQFSAGNQVIVVWIIVEVSLYDDFLWEGGWGGGGDYNQGGLGLGLGTGIIITTRVDNI